MRSISPRRYKGRGADAIVYAVLGGLIAILLGTALLAQDFYVDAPNPQTVAHQAGENFLLIITFRKPVKTWCVQLWDSEQQYREADFEGTPDVPTHCCHPKASEVAAIDVWPGDWKKFFDVTILWYNDGSSDVLSAPFYIPELNAPAR